MPRHIVVPLDMSRFSEFALPVAFSVLRDGDKLELLSVLEPPLPLAWDGYEEISLSEVEHYLDDVLTRASKGVGRDVQVTTRLLRGDAAVELGRYTQDAAPDLVVMTSHGRGPLNRLWLGGVTDKVVRHSASPVLIVRPSEEDLLELEPWPAPKSVMVPLDGSDVSEMVFGKLALLGDPAELETRLVRVVTYPRTVASAYLPHTMYENRITVEDERSWIEKYLDEVTARSKDRGMRHVTSESLVAQSAAAGILEAAQKSDPDVIALVTHARKGIDRLILGSVADKVIRGADRPVLVIPSPKELWHRQANDAAEDRARVTA